jgi:hypothetical protein
MFWEAGRADFLVCSKGLAEMGKDGSRKTKDECRMMNDEWKTEERSWHGRELMRDQGGGNWGLLLLRTPDSRLRTRLCSMFWEAEGERGNRVCSKEVDNEGQRNGGLES